MTNAQRALWTFLIYTLLAPFLAALAVTVVLALGAAFGLADLLPGDAPPIGQAALATFVWSAVPAVLTAIALVVLTQRAGGFSWIMAAAVAVVAFAVAAAVLPFGQGEAGPYLAFLAGLVSIAVREVLVRIGIIAALS
jgi:hypothetical protein